METITETLEQVIRKTGQANWTEIRDAINEAHNIPTGQWMKVRGHLQTLMIQDKVERAPFDPALGERYNWIGVGK